MINRFEASCWKCQRGVPAGKGETNLVAGRWATQHNEGECSNRQDRVIAAAYGNYMPDADDNMWTSEDVNPLEGCK